MRILDDLRFVLRGLRNKTPFLLVALTTLALSMGASSAMFTIVNTFLLSSLPYEDADRLVTVWNTSTETSQSQLDEEIPLSPGAFIDLSENARSFERVAALVSDFVNVAVDGEPSRVHFLYAVGDFFSLLRTEAALGRALGPADQQPAAPRVVMISHGYWQRQFGGDPEILGRLLEIYGRDHEVVGVLPADFRFTESLIAADPRFSRPVDVWAPFSLEDRASQRGFHFLVVVGRLKPGTGLEAAREEIRAYAEDAARRYPDTDKAFGMKLVPLSDQVFGHLRPVLLTLWAATSFVVLVACANLATLLLARGQTGQRDVAVRLALGANRARVIGQSLATTLLIGTGLSARSFVGLLRADLGVDLERVVTLDLYLPPYQYRDTPRKIGFFRDLLESTRRLPGVESVGMNYGLPFSGFDPSNSFEIEGRPPFEAGKIQSANLGLVNPDYFKTLGIPLLRGRFFQDSDREDAPPVAIIDERMVEQYFDGEEPLGRRISIASDTKTTIVGVVGAVRQDAFEDKVLPYVYLPYQQRSYVFTSLAVKTSLEEPLDIAAAVQRLVRDLDEGLPIANVSTLEEAYRKAIAPQRFSLLLISVFAGVALFLTQVGTYGVTSFLARQRRHEAGVRMALGAQPRQVFGLVFRQGLTLSVAGTALGLGVAAGAGNAMASLVYGIETLDVLVFSVVGLAILLAAFVSYSLPARFLSRVEPSGSLR